MPIISFIVHCYHSILNGRSILQLLLNFLLNFSPVFLWLFCFKLAKYIPISWRPNINIKWLPLTDSYLFDVFKPSSYLFFISLIIISILPFQSKNWTHYNRKSSKIIHYLIIFSWPLLNLLNLEVSYFNQSFIKDLASYISYVLFHLIVPIVMSIYLYVFTIPGTLALYSYCLGIQNLLALSTHLIAPSSPPWFIHLNGLNATADYNTLGYAAGLTRLDIKLGTNLATNGFHKSPIVFGAFPSVHSAMATLTCLFIFWFSYQNSLKVFAFFYVLLQWWSTIYLDHHWRLDLIAGMFYSILTFSTIKYFFPNNFYLKSSSPTSTPSTPSSLESGLYSISNSSSDNSLNSLVVVDVNYETEKPNVEELPLFNRIFPNISIV